MRREAEAGDTLRDRTTANRDQPMFLRLPLPLRLPLIVLLLVGSTFLHVGVLLLATLVKALVAGTRARARLSGGLVRIAESWIGFNSTMMDRCTRTRWEIALPEGLERERSYLVLSNHQSWVDIPVLQYVFNRRIPFLRFFLKAELIWVPLLGPAWWALDFPFMKRYTKEQLARRPELAGTDIDATRRACEKFREIPVAVMNFVEGTRFTPEKHARQPSPFRHLLRPKAGGVAFVLDAMGGALGGILDVTIVYPNGRPTLGDLLRDRVREIRVQVVQREIPAEAVGADYETDAEFRAGFQQWINTLWSEKDARFDAMLGANAPET
jgi:1-acyl-sn-glycerol-3-phosphate acyltransferase